MSARRAVRGAADWSTQEIDRIVANHFAMLGHDIAGTPYVKAQHRRELRRRIDRSEGSIEFKHQNINAVMLGLGGCHGSSVTNPWRISGKHWSTVCCAGSTIMRTGSRRRRIFPRGNICARAVRHRGRVHHPPQGSISVPPPTGPNDCWKCKPPTGGTAPPFILPATRSRWRRTGGTTGTSCAYGISPDDPALSKCGRRSIFTLI